MCVVQSPTDDKWQAMLPKLDRNTVPNKHLLKQKMHRRIPWNHTVLRFRWHEDHCVASSVVDEKNSDVLKQVAAAMRNPISATDAFAVRSWAKSGPGACVGVGPTTSGPCSSSGCV